MKPKLLFRAPVLTASGYGVHSRQLLQALLAANVFDVSVRAISWGQTPFLVEDDEFLNHVRELMVKAEQEERQKTQYDISIQVTIPNEFEKLAKVNIGVTAGIEVDRVSSEWLRKSNENVDLVIVPSKHSAETFAGIQYKNEKGQELRLVKPLAVCPEGVDTDIYNTSPLGPTEKELFKFDSEFNFLCVGLGLDKGMGEDRKNIALLVKWFLETFSGSSDIGLVLKVGMVTNSLMDFESTKRRLEEIRKSVGCGPLPRIQLVHGRLSDREMAALYKNDRIKALVSLTHGEGFGLPILEAAACGLPVVATNWSGHLDFLKIEDKKRFVSLDFDLGEIPQRVVWKGVMDPGSRWANVKETEAKLKLKKVVVSYDKPLEWAKELAVFVRDNFSLPRTGLTFVQTLAQFLNHHQMENPETPEQFASAIRAQLQAPPGSKTLLFTMPMSAGDVYISTAVVDSLKKKFPDHLIFFGTQDKYAPILRKNPNIHRVIRFENWMGNVPLLEQVFDEVYTPNLAIQTLSANWVHGGKGRLLGNEIAHQCDVPFGDYHIDLEPVQGLPEKYIVLHPGSGKGQWEARNYNHWSDVVANMRKLFKVPIVQVGLEDDPAYEGCVDLRGKTTYNQLASVVQNALCVVGIDTVSMHMAAGLGTPHVALFGSSYSTSTGPVYKKEVPHDLIETPNRMGCEKACYKYQCVVDRESPCVNEIDPANVVGAVSALVDDSFKNLPFEYEETFPKISGYTHVLNAETHAFPYMESIKSMLGFCDEVVVVDGGSTDGTREKIEAIGDPRLKVLVREWDWNEPGMDGMQKAFGRAMCTGEFLWQQDADEVVHEDDYDKIRKLVKRFPKDADLIHLPVVELWGNEKRVRTDRHAWKWRLSRNNFRITHGINKAARVVEVATGKTFARKGMSDGCEYIDVMTGEYIPHKGFYTQELELIRRNNPQEYGRVMNHMFKTLPSVYHYSWADLPRKIRNFKAFWNKCWSNLYDDPQPEDRFPDVNGDDPNSIAAKAVQLFNQGGEHGPAETFLLEKENPSLVKEWLRRVSVTVSPEDIDAIGRSVHNGEGQAETSL